MKPALVAVSGVAIGTHLIGCGGGGGDTPSGPPAPPPPPTPAPGPQPCPDLMARGHCTQCAWEGSWKCKSCTGGYTLDATATGEDNQCVKQCPSSPPPRPGKPGGVTDLNGKAWPAACFPVEQLNFLGIGDWGGMCEWNGAHCEAGKVSGMCGWTYPGEGNVLPGKPCPFPNGSPHGGPHPQIEGKMQSTVNDRMVDRKKELTAAGHPPQFIINVGDNFYPGGIDVHCGLGDVSATQQQFEQIWKNVYPELTNSKDLEWWGVLGNHDYGGTCYRKGWDQQIWYTFNQDVWVMPAQYWMRTVQTKTFKVDFFFLDGNWFDTDNAHAAQNHDICSQTQDHCEAQYYPGSGVDCPSTGPHNIGECAGWFDNLWSQQYTWIMQVVPASNAEWQIIVNHYPGVYHLGNGDKSIRWQEWMPKMGIELMISGHEHKQKVWHGQDYGPVIGDWTQSASVITGGGGGVVSQEPGGATLGGKDDAYGFTEFNITLGNLNIKSWSHGGTTGKLILQHEANVAPLERSSDEEIIAAGLDPQGLLKKREIEV